MGNDKSFYTLLNKYNTLLAQTQDLKEQLDKSKENNAEILQKDKVVEKNLRDLCADILAKDPNEMKLGQEYSWDTMKIKRIFWNNWQIPVKTAVDRLKA